LKQLGTNTTGERLEIAWGAAEAPAEMRKKQSKTPENVKKKSKKKLLKREKNGRVSRRFWKRKW